MAGSGVIQARPFPAMVVAKSRGLPLDSLLTLECIFLAAQEEATHEVISGDWKTKFVAP